MVAVLNRVLHRFMTVAMQSLEEQAPLIHQNNGMLGNYESSGPLFKRPAQAQISIV